MNHQHDEPDCYGGVIAPGEDRALWGGVEHDKVHENSGSAFLSI